MQFQYSDYSRSYWKLQDNRHQQMYCKSRFDGRSFSISYGATGGLSSTTTTLLKTTTTIKTTTTTTLPKTTTTIFYAAPYCPDINRNGVIDTNDVSLVQNAYSQTNCSPYDCDLNNDGLVSIDDIIAVSDAVSSSPLKYPC